MNCKLSLISQRGSIHFMCCFPPPTLTLLLMFREIRSERECVCVCVCGCVLGIVRTFYTPSVYHCRSAVLCCADNLCLLNHKCIWCYWFQENPFTHKHTQTVCENDTVIVYEVNCHPIWWVSRNHHMRNALVICTHMHWHLVHQTHRYTSCDITTAHSMGTYSTNV